MSYITNLKSISNFKVRRTSLIHEGVSLLIIDNSSQHLNSDNKNLHLNFVDYCFVFCCTDILQCIKYFKKVSSREYVILLFHNFDKDKIQKMISQIDRYEQIQAIFILHSSANDDDSQYKIHDNNDGKCSYGSRIKLIKRFCEWKPLFTSLRQLIIDTENSFKDTGLFTMCNSPEKALRDLRRELGSFVWTHTFRGSYTY
jgi:hypothetical protein